MIFHPIEFWILSCDNCSNDNFSLQEVLSVHNDGKMNKKNLM
jgi:hypothetical protein